MYITAILKESCFNAHTYITIQERTKFYKLDMHGWLRHTNSVWIIEHIISHLNLSGYLYGFLLPFFPLIVCSCWVFTLIYPNFVGTMALLSCGG